MQWPQTLQHKTHEAHETQTPIPAHSAPTPDPVEFARTRLNFHPDPHQSEILRSASKQGIVNCTRQWGKSTVAAAKAVHRAVTRPGSLVLVAAPAYRQSAELVRKARHFAAQLKLPLRHEPGNAASILFPNGSRILGIPGREDTVRGYSASLLLVDEASRVPDPLYTALRPMLAVSQGDIWLMSTPNGKQGFFYDAWEHGGPAWHRISVAATDCPRLPAGFLEEERTQLTGAAFRQEYMAEFVGGGAGVFDRDMIDAALDSSIPPLPMRLQLFLARKGDS